jgi:hypothetical protein
VTHPPCLITLLSLSSVTGSQTKTLIERIQEDVAHLRLYAEQQEQDGQGIGKYSNKALVSEGGLNIDSYQLPLRRYLEETESLLDPDYFPLQEGSVNSMDPDENENILTRETVKQGELALKQGRAIMLFTIITIIFVSPRLLTQFSQVLTINSFHSRSSLL